MFNSKNITWDKISVIRDDSLKIKTNDETIIPMKPIKIGFQITFFD